MTEAGLVTDPGHATGADGVEVFLVQREVRTTEVAGTALPLTRSAAGRAAHHGRVMRSGTVHPQDRSAQTTEPRSRGQASGIELASAIGTSHQNAHSKKNGARGPGSQSSSPQPNPATLVGLAASFE